MVPCQSDKTLQREEIRRLSHCLTDRLIVREFRYLTRKYRASERRSPEVKAWVQLLVVAPRPEVVDKYMNIAMDRPKVNITE
jgi:hypothetical protein